MFPLSSLLTKYIKYLLSYTIFTLIYVNIANAQNINNLHLLPTPKQVDWNGKYIKINNICLLPIYIDPNVYADTTLINVATKQIINIFQSKKIKQVYTTKHNATNIQLCLIKNLPFNFDSTQVKNTGGLFAFNNNIITTIGNTKEQEYKYTDLLKEAYILTISHQGTIKIEATTAQGLYLAVQTLRQLLINQQLPIVKIQDFPAFPVRGFMHDVGRSFISIEEIKKEIKKLSQYKINIFHWHLTENQAWRLQSKIYPQLTSPQNATRDKGKFYSLQQAQDLAQFCKMHNVLLIPEIDMPGHSGAFTRCFGVDMQSKEGIEILKNIIKEICDNIDVPYIHIGTDEVEFKNPNFVPTMVNFIHSLNKKIISWTPGYNYKAKEVSILQMWSSRAKVYDGFKFIDSRYHYINHFDTFADIVALYFSKIGDTPIANNQIIGSIIGVWNDRKLKDENSILNENNFYPSMLTLAQRAWQGNGTEYFNNTGTKIETNVNSPKYKEFKAFEDNLLWHKDHNFIGYSFPYYKQTDMLWRITEAFPNEGKTNTIFPIETLFCDANNFNNKPNKTHKITTLQDSITLTHNGISVKSYLARGAGIYLRHVWGKIIPGFYAVPKENSTSYAYTYVYSPKNQDVGLLAEFQNYSRSEPDFTPPQGEWDYKGSKIWINNKPIAPPAWTSNCHTRNNEIVLGNENFVSRPPIKVHLKKGWNKIFLKLPIGKFNDYPRVRLVKWMFVVKFIDLNGKELNTLKYNPDI